MTCVKDNSFEKVLQIIPDHVQANGNLGICYKKQKDFHKARTYLNRAVELDCNYGLAINNLETLRRLESGEIEEMPTIIETHYYADILD